MNPQQFLAFGTFAMGLGCDSGGPYPTGSVWPYLHSGVPRGGLGGGFNPPPEIQKALQNRAKLNRIVKTVKDCWI